MDNGLRRQDNDPLFYGAEELGKGAAAQVGAADIADKEGVAGEQVAGREEADGAGTVARGMDDPDLSMPTLSRSPSRRLISARPSTD